MSNLNLNFIEKDTAWTTNEDRMLFNWVNAGVITDTQMARNLKRSLTSVRWRIKVLKSENDQRTVSELSADEIATMRSNCRSMCQYYLFHTVQGDMDAARKQFLVSKNFFNAFFREPSQADLEYIRGFKDAYDHFLNLFHIHQKPRLVNSKTMAFCGSGNTQTTKQPLQKSPAPKKGVDLQIQEQKIAVPAIEIPGLLKESDYMPVAKDLVHAYNDSMARFHNLEEEYHSVLDVLKRLHQSIENLKKED